jgi:hypothetical protein
MNGLTERDLREWRMRFRFRLVSRELSPLIEIAARLACNASATSDTLLIVSDAIRDYGNEVGLLMGKNYDALVKEMHALADDLASAASARANPHLSQEPTS